MVSTNATAERALWPHLYHRCFLIQARGARHGLTETALAAFPSNIGLSFSDSLRDGGWPLTESEKEKRNFSLCKMNIPMGAERG